MNITKEQLEKDMQNPYYFQPKDKNGNAVSSYIYKNKNGELKKGFIIGGFVEISNTNVKQYGTNSSDNITLDGVECTKAYNLTDIPKNELNNIDLQTAIYQKNGQYFNTRDLYSKSVTSNMTNALTHIGTTEEHGNKVYFGVIPIVIGTDYFNKKVKLIIDTNSIEKINDEFHIDYNYTQSELMAMHENKKEIRKEIASKSTFKNNIYKDFKKKADNIINYENDNERTL